MKLHTLTLTNPISRPIESGANVPEVDGQRVALAKQRNLILTAISEAKIHGFHATEEALIALLREVQHDLKRLQDRDDRKIFLSKSVQKKHVG